MRYIICFLLLSFSVVADQVILTDGSVIKGEIIKVHEDNLTIESNLIGKLKIKLANVISYKTDSPVKFRVADGDVKTEKYNSEVDEKVNTLWSGDRDPDVFLNRWERIIWFNFVKKNGNKDEENIDGGFELRYLREFDTLKLYAEFTNNTRNERKTSDDYTWGADYEARFGEQQRHSWYLRAKYEKDRIKDLDLRSTYAAGYGYYFIKDPLTILRGRTGLLYRTEDYIEDDSTESVGIDFGLSFEKTLFDSLKWFTEITFAPAFEDFGDYQFVHESGLEVPFDIEDFDLSLKSGVKHEYDSRPAEGTNELDTRYFMRLQLKF